MRNANTVFLTVGETVEIMDKYMSTLESEHVYDSFGRSAYIALWSARTYGRLFLGHVMSGTLAAAVTIRWGREKPEIFYSHPVTAHADILHPVTV